MYKVLLGAVAAVAMATAFAQSQETTAEIPSVEIPKDLQVYTRSAELIATGNEVIDVLKTANFSERRFAEKTSESCKAEQIGEIHRGLMVFQLAYYFAVSKLEKGYVNADFCCDRDAALKQPNRIALLSILQPAFIGELIGLRGRLAELPAPVKKSLITFLEELQRFRIHYSHMKRNEERLEYIFKRMEDSYPSVRNLIDSSWLLTDKADKDGLTLKSIREYNESQKQTAWESSDDLRELANSNRDFWGSSVSECLDGFTESVIIAFGGNDPVTKELNSMPTMYMTRFWRRREQEGTTVIAMFVVEQAIKALQAEN